MEILLGWFVFAVLVGVAAGSRGRSGFGWFILSCLISPLIGILILLAMPVLGRPSPVLAGAEAASPSTHVRCPDCRELVRKDARKCKHCGIVLTPQE
jgi:hypothetical protein